MWHGFPAQPVAMCSFESDLIMATGCAGKPCHTSRALCVLFKILLVFLCVSVTLWLASGWTAYIRCPGNWLACFTQAVNWASSITSPSWMWK